MKKNQENYILGISLGFNSSAAFLKYNKLNKNVKYEIVSAISQERINCIKNTKELPIDVILKMAKENNITYIDEVKISHYQKTTKDEIVKNCPMKYRDILPLDLNEYNSGNDLLMYMLITILQKENITLNNVYERVNHHVAHKNTSLAIYGIPDKNYSYMTYDGFGDACSGEFVIVCNNINVSINTSRIKNSLGLVYQFFTGALGFKEHQHEGKITGLAAYGKHNEKLIERFESSYLTIHGYVNIDYFKLTTQEEIYIQESPIEDFEEFLRLKKLIYKFVQSELKMGTTKADLAYLVQNFVEREIINVLNSGKNDLINAKVSEIYLSGGLFANVKLNQRIRELFTEWYNNKDTENEIIVNIAPPMGDEGNAIGAAFSAITDLLYAGYKMIKQEDKSYQTFVSENTKCGSLMNMYTKKEIRKALNSMETKGKYIIYETDKKHIVDALSNKKIVCICKDKMEFGPRALCNRSILYDCKEQETNDWLNKKLGRTEFMPFAPVCLSDFANDLFYDWNEKQITSMFMTMTYNCKQEMIENYKAAVHIDNTARPQIIYDNDESSKYIKDILLEYYKKTNKKALINTSFNLHNYPIVENIETAIYSFVKAELHMLVLENYIIERID